jgi:hypothetical protein
MKIDNLVDDMRLSGSSFLQLAVTWPIPRGPYSTVPFSAFRWTYCLAFNVQEDIDMVLALGHIISPIVAINRGCNLFHGRFLAVLVLIGRVQYI